MAVMAGGQVRRVCELTCTADSYSVGQRLRYSSAHQDYVQKQTWEKWQIEAVSTVRE